MLAQLSRRSVVALVVIALVALIGCQNTPMEPAGQTSGPSLQLLKANPEVMGLAKGEISETVTVSADQGAVLGGADMSGNYVSIPANTLKSDMDLTFKIYVNDSGILVFQIHSDEVPIDENILFQDGQNATVAVNKDWLAGQPNVAVHSGTDEMFGVQDGGDVWLVSLPHFSNYYWAIAD